MSLSEPFARPRKFSSAALILASYSFWNSFSGVTGLKSRRIQKSSLKSLRSSLSISSKVAFSCAVMMRADFLLDPVLVALAQLVLSPAENGGADNSEGDGRYPHSIL